jgi:tellurite resistance protein
MDIPLVDRGNYYRGLLVLIRKDQVINELERELMLRIGKILDFDRRFCEEAIKDVLNNKYIKREPMLFSCPEVAERFMIDALRLAFIDGELHPTELSWLRAVAHANGLLDGWIEDEMQKFDKEELVRFPSK